MSLPKNPHLKKPYTIWIFCRNQNWYAYDKFESLEACVKEAVAIRSGDKFLPLFYRNPNLDEIKVTGKGVQYI